jgi:hypothetical protein
MQQPKDSECSSPRDPSKLQSKSLQMPSRPIAKCRALWRRLSRSAWIALVFLKWPQHFPMPLSSLAGYLAHERFRQNADQSTGLTSRRHAARNVTLMCDRDGVAKRSVLIFDRGSSPTDPIAASGPRARTPIFRARDPSGIRGLVLCRS